MTIIYPIKLKISNCFLVKGSKNILIDTGSPGEEKKIIKSIAKLGVQLSDLSLILHTHGHSDHCGSTTQLLKHHKIPTAIHSADSEMTENGNNGIVKTRGIFAKLIKPFVNIPFPAFKADIFIDDYRDLTDFGINGKIHSTKGHTNGSISVEFDNGEAVIGDMMMGGFLGGALFPQQPDYHYFVDSINNVHQSINIILNFSSDKFYVGHGGPLKRNNIEKWFKGKQVL